MTTITPSSPRLDRFVLILLRSTPKSIPAPIPEFDVDASLAAAGWVDIHTREQLAAAIRERPMRPASPLCN
jgi:hypothetical protein